MGTTSMAVWSRLECAVYHHRCFFWLRLLFILQRSGAFLVILPFILNLLFNFAFTPIQFGLKNNLLATIDILLVLTTLIWALYAIYHYVPWVSYINLPYLAWVCFASVLQLTITYLNF